MGGVGFGGGNVVCYFVVCSWFVLLVVVCVWFWCAVWWCVLVCGFWGLIFGLVCGSIILVKKGGTVLRCSFGGWF